MSDSNHLEAQLQSWKPRRPSADLKKAIFEVNDTASARPSCREVLPPWFSRMAVQNWIGPAVACCLTFLTLFGSMASSWNHSTVREVRTVYMVSVPSGTGKADYALSAPDENLEWNVWTRPSFDWTNEGQFLSTNRSLQVAQTNYLMQ